MERHLRFICRAHRRRCTSHADGVLPAGERYRADAVPLTGEYDSDTQAAVRRAQQIFQLPQTGLTDRATWQALAGLHNALFRRTPLGWSMKE